MKTKNKIKKIFNNLENFSKKIKIFIFILIIPMVICKLMPQDFFESFFYEEKNLDEKYLLNSAADLNIIFAKKQLLEMLKRKEITNQYFFQLELYFNMLINNNKCLREDLNEISQTLKIFSCNKSYNEAYLI